MLAPETVMMTDTSVLPQRHRRISSVAGAFLPSMLGGANFKRLWKIAVHRQPVVIFRTYIAFENNAQIRTLNRTRHYLS